MTREEAFREAFQRAKRCNAISPSGFQCQEWAGKRHHPTYHWVHAGGARRSWLRGRAL